jgi:penicillin amidase
LDYRPEPWTPIDCLMIESEFRWYLTGRFPVIVIPELARRTLGEGSLYRAFLEVESDAESILPPGSYPRGRFSSQPVGTAAGDPPGGGSNNWVVSGHRSASRSAMVASDPHIAFEAVSCWCEVHLCGGSFSVVGTAYAGMPAVMFGRNKHVAWACTNNICSHCDLYQEKTDPQHPQCFLYDGKWEPAGKREEVIAVKGGPSVRKTIRSSRNSPLFDDVLPTAARGTGTGSVALKWLGTYRGGWLTALLGMDRAKSASDFHEAMRWMASKRRGPYQHYDSIRPREPICCNSLYDPMLTVGGVYCCSMQRSWCDAATHVSWDGLGRDTVAFRWHYR